MIEHEGAVIEYWLVKGGRSYRESLATPRSCEGMDKLDAGVCEPHRYMEEMGASRAAIANMTSRGLTVAVYAVRLEASPPFAVSKGNQ